MTVYHNQLKQVMKIKLPCYGTNKCGPTYLTDEITLHVAQTVNTDNFNTEYLRNVVCFRYIIVNTVHRGDNSDNKNNTLIQILISLTDFSSHIRSSPLATRSPQSTITYLYISSLPLLFLPVCGQLMALLLLLMVSGNVGKSNVHKHRQQCRIIVTWEIPGLFGLPNRTLLDTGTENFKIHKTGTVPGKLGRIGS
jgi:hypothetical protein